MRRPHLAAGSSTTDSRSRRRLLAIAALVVLLAAGCGRAIAGEAGPVAGAVATAESTSDRSTATATGTSQSPSPEGTPSMTAASTTPVSTSPTTKIKWLLPFPDDKNPAKNKFGNQIAHLGRSYGINWTAKKTVALIFVVDSAKVDAPCSTPSKPENGHFLIISVRVQLGDATGDELSNGAIGFTDQFWTAFDPKDTAEVGTSSAATLDCLATGTAFPFASDLSPGKVYSGKIALDVRSAKGTVVLMNSLGGGWIYDYG